MGLAAANLVLTGGNANFPQFEERFYGEIRPSVPDVFDMQSYLPENPESYAWRGAQRFVQNNQSNGQLRRQMVSRAEYLERGHHYCNEKFFKGW